MQPLCLGMDPGATSAVALVEPALRPRLLCLRVIPAGLDADAWAERAFLAFEAVKNCAGSLPVVGWYELTCPPPGNGWMGNNALSMRRGQLLAHASDAGLSLAGIEHVMVQTWTSTLGVERKKLGDGGHRISEAERLVEMDPMTFRGLTGAVDAAESVLMAAARSWKLLGIQAPKKPRASARKGRAA
jgi:hypothetical protein